MLKIKISAILLVFLIAIYTILPNFGIKIPFVENKISLGLDLQGGSSLLLKVDLDYSIKEKTNFLLDNVKFILNNSKVPFAKIYILDGTIYLQSDSEKKNIKAIHSILTRELSGKIEHKVEADILKVKYTKDYIYEINQSVIKDTIQNLRRRVDELGTKEAVIYAQGADGVLVQMPGLNNPEALKNIIGKTAKLTFHTMAEKGSLNKVMVHDKKGNKFYVNKRAELGGDLFKNVSLHMGKMGKPSISVQFNSLGTRKFAEVTKENVNKQLAIVLDGIMLTNPVIREYISNGQAEISGNFSAKEAKELIILLRSGSLPAPLTVVEERIVGPSLGAESVNQSEKAAICALALIILLMVAIYGTFGSFAVISLLFNLSLMLSLIILLNITLTLPGIAGLILTIGMAVDTNILIFERIKDEYKNKQSLHNVIEKGFKHATSTIIDSNFTTLIASLIMFCFGSSSIKGFAITVSIGIFSSLISGIFVTHNIIKLWFMLRKPTNIPMGFLNY